LGLANPCLFLLRLLTIQPATEPKAYDYITRALSGI
jgi:hypothetical protein